MITVKMDDAGTKQILLNLGLAAPTTEEGKRALFAVLQTLMDGARARWVELAGQRLRSSRRAYVQGIQKVVSERRGLSLSVSLVGALANMVEQGASAFDLHEAFLSGSKGMRTAGGRVRAIPFRHASPDATSYQAGIPIGASYEGHPEVSDASQLAKSVYQAVRRLAPSVREQPGGPVKWGQRLPAGLAPNLKPFPAHLTDIYAGMYRQTKTYEKARQSQYITFRSIAVDDDGSPNPPGTWVHPGIAPADLSYEVADYLAEQAQAAVAAFVGSRK